MEGIGKNLDELAEVHTFVSDIVEDSLVAIPDILHRRFSSSGPRSLAIWRLWIVVSCSRLLASLHLSRIHLFGKSVDTLDVILRLEVCLLNLEFYQSG